jgi:hypothetical protein
MLDIVSAALSMGLQEDGGEEAETWCMLHASDWFCMSTYVLTAEL